MTFMIDQNFKSKRLLILSDDSIIFDAIADNIPKYFNHYQQNNVGELVVDRYDDHLKVSFSGKTLLVQQKSTLDDANFKIDKMDVVFINQHINLDYIEIFRLNIIVNLNNFLNIDNSITLSKPCMLHDLIKIIMRNFYDDIIFCCINKNWIYHEGLSCLKSIDQIINLTDKENILFKTLLAKNHFKCEKDYLRFNVWNYHLDSESNTVETHLYKLKAKLPIGLLELKNTYCQLGIKDLS